MNLIINIRGKPEEFFYTIREDKECLCVSTQTEILQFISEKIGRIEIGEELIISKTPFDWEIILKGNK